MGERNSIAETCRRYMVWVLVLAAVMVAGGALLEKAAYGVIAAVFHTVCSLAYIWGWKALAHRSPGTLPKYYLAGSAFRLMAAAAVVLVFCVVNRSDIDAIRWFALLFIVSYIVMLAFDAVFFAKVSKNITIK